MPLASYRRERTQLHGVNTRNPLELQRFHVFIVF